MKTAVILFNLGGPDSLKAVKPFLFNLFNDPAIIGAPKPIRYLLAKLISSRREKKAQGIYAQMGGRSPILPQTEAQAEALQAQLNEGSTDQWRCFIAMRYWNPRAEAALKDVMQWGPDRVVLLPLYPQFSTTTTASSLREWLELCEQKGFKPKTTAVCCYHNVDGWVDALAQATRQTIKQSNATPLVLFSAHGLPQKVIDAGDPYQWQVEQTVRAVRTRLRDLNFDSEICYQSRVGPLKWIEPSTEHCIVEGAKSKRHIVVVPVAFVSEHSETLVELDIEYRHLALKHGAKSYARVPAVQTDETFIDGLKMLALKAVKQEAGILSGNDGETAHCPPSCKQCPRQKANRAIASGASIAEIGGLAAIFALAAADSRMRGWGIDTSQGSGSSGFGDSGFGGGDAGGGGGDGGGGK